MGRVFFIQPTILSTSHFQGTVLGFRAGNEHWGPQSLYPVLETYYKQIDKLIKYFRWPHVNKI